MRDSVIIKCSGNMVEIWLGDTLYSEIKDNLTAKLDQNKAFYMGTKQKVMFFGKRLSDAQKRELRSILFSDYEIKNVGFVDEDTAEQAPEPTPEPKKEYPVEEYFPTQAQGLMMTGTLRNGQRVQCEGDLVVIGDVNPGAELIAGGSIIVFGKLRGLAHAGAYGKRDALIVTNALLANQIRICGKISVIPTGRKIEGPEKAELNGDKIVIHTIG